MSRSIVIFLLLVNLYSLLCAQSIEQGNAFNKFMSAEGGVNPLSGSVAFNKTLTTISSGLASYNVEMSYSGNVQEIVKNKNDIAVSGWVGLGWSLGHAKIVANDAGSMWLGDDSYYLLTESGNRFEIIKDQNGKWWIEGLPYWNVNPSIKAVSFEKNNIKKVYQIICGWELTSDAGIKYTYGDMQYPVDKNSANQNATEYTIANPYSLGIVGTYENGATEQFPNAWNLARIEDYNGNYLNFSYEQYMEKVRVNMDRDRPLYITESSYTKECYLKSISSRGGEKIVFNTKRKNFNREFIDNKGLPEDNSGSFVENNGVYEELNTIIPDSYIDPIDRRYLSQIVVYGNDGSIVKYIDFCYEPLDVQIKGSVNDDYVKRLLVSVSEKSSKGNKIQKESFEYIRKELDENNNPLPFGAMESIQGTNCGVVKYEYKEMTLVEVDENTGLHKEHFDFTNFGIGHLSNGTDYLVGGNSVYFKTLNEWVLQQTDIKMGSQSPIYAQENWFVTTTPLDAKGEKLKYHIYTWNGEKWDNIGSYDENKDTKFIKVGSDYLLFAHAADNKIEWEIPWSRWGKKYTGIIDGVSTLPSDRDQIKTLVGKKHFAIYYKARFDFMASGIFKIISFNSEKETVETFHKEDLDYVDVAVLDDNTFVGINEDGDEAFVCQGYENENNEFKWKYLKLKELNGFQGTESFQAIGDNYFVVKHNDYDNMSLFQYNGNSWETKYSNKNMVFDQDFDPFTEAEWDAVPGHNFFIARMPKIKKHFPFNEIHPFFKYCLYERNDNGDWTVGDIINNNNPAIIYAGSDWYFVKDSRIGYVKNGFDWNLEDYATLNKKSKFLTDIDNFYHSQKTYVTVAGNYFVHRQSGNTNGVDVYYKKNDSFKAPVKGFFVSKKIIKDAVVDKVVSFEYDYSSNSQKLSPVYDFVNKTASVRAFTITLPNYSGVVEKILCNYKNGVAHGEICFENYYNVNSYDSPIKTIKKEYIRYKGENIGWPKGIYVDRPVLTTTKINNLSKTEKYTYADGVNGMVSSIVLYDDNKNENVSETVEKYAVDKYAELKLQNRLTEKNLIYRCIPDCNSEEGEVVSGKLLTYKFENKEAFEKNENVKPDIHVLEEWVYTPLKSERMKASSIEQGDVFLDKGWTRSKLFTSYKNGVANESVNQLGVKTSVILENGVVNWSVASVTNAGLDQILVLPGDECDIKNWKKTDDVDKWPYACTEIPLDGRSFENKDPLKATNYGRFAKTAILVDRDHSLVGRLEKAKKSKYRFSAWVQGTSSGNAKDKLQLWLESSLMKEFDLSSDGKWQYIEWLSDYELNDKEYKFTLSGENNSNIHLQDVRFVPEDALVEVSFYDKVWGTKIAKSDDRSVGSYFEYDDLGRIVETYGEMADESIVKKSKSTYTSGVCAVSTNNADVLKKLVINGVNIAIPTNSRNIVVPVNNGTNKLNVLWNSYVEGEETFYSLHNTGTKKEFEKTACAGSCFISEEFEGNSMTLDIAVSSLDNPYSVTIVKSTSGWIDYGKPLTTGKNPTYLSNNNVAGVRYLQGDKIKEVLFNGTDWVGLSEDDKKEVRGETKVYYESLVGSVNDGIDYVIALPNFMGTSNGDPYFWNTSNLNAKVFKNAAKNGMEPKWDAMGTLDGNGVKGEKYRVTTTSNNKTYVLYEKTNYIELPQQENSRLRNFSSENSLVVKQLVNGKWGDETVVALAAEKNSPSNKNEKTTSVKTSYSFDDADIAVGRDNVPFVAYIGKVNDYSVPVFLLNTDPNDGELGDVIPDNVERAAYVEYPSVLIVKHFDFAKNKWVGYTSEKGDFLNLSDGTPLLNASKVKLASDGQNLYIAVLCDEEKTSQKALKVYHLQTSFSGLIFEEQIDKSFGSSSIAYLTENDHFDLSVYDNKPYVSFANSSNKGYITVVKFEEGLWKSIGNPAFAYVSTAKNSADLAVDGSGNPYVVLQEGILSDISERINKIVPMKYSSAGDCNLMISSVGKVPGTSIAKDFRQYILNYSATVPMTTTSLPFDITFVKGPDVQKLVVEHNGKIINQLNVNTSSSVMFDVDLVADANEIKLHVYGSEKTLPLIYSFNIRREFVYGFNFSSKMMGVEIGNLVFLDEKYEIESSSSSNDGSSNGNNALTKNHITTVGEYEYHISPTDGGTTTRVMCLGYNSHWNMIVNGNFFSKPECLEYDILNSKFIISAGSSEIGSSSSTQENEVLFIDENGNKKIVSFIVESSSSPNENDSEGSSENANPSDDSSSSRNEYVEGTVIPSDYSSLYNYKLVAGNKISFENNVSIEQGDYITSTVYVAAGANIHGNIKCSGNMTLSNNAYVQSISLGGTLTSEPEARYGSLDNVNVSVPSICQKTFDIGKETVNVWAGESKVMSPGLYGDVFVYANANVIFKPGVYYFKSLYIAPDVTIKTENVSDAVQFWVQNGFEIGDRSSFMTENDPNQVFVYSNGSSRMYIGVSTSASATIVYPNGPVNFAPHSKFFGHIWSDWVTVGANTTIK